MTPNWPELWAREPGLRPARLIRNQGDWVVELWTDPAGLNSHHAIVADDLAAALCRDAAVRWLCEGTNSDNVLGVEIFGKDPWIVRVLPEDPAWQFENNSLYAALFAACKAVLDARDKPA